MVLGCRKYRVLVKIYITRAYANLSSNYLGGFLFTQDLIHTMSVTENITKCRLLLR